MRRRARHPLRAVVRGDLRMTLDTTPIVDATIEFGGVEETVVIAPHRCRPRRSVLVPSES